MAGQALRVLGAVALVAVVAVLARPSQPDVPPPFGIERETALPAPDGPGVATADPGASPSPSPPGARAAAYRLMVQALGAGGVEPGSPPVLEVETGGYTRAQLSSDGRWLLVAIAQPHPEGTTLLRRYELDAPEPAPPVLTTVPAFADWVAFTPEGDALVWLENHDHRGLRIAGEPLAGRDHSEARWRQIGLPSGVRVLGAAALTGQRVGVVVFEETGRSPAGWGLGRARLLVADLDSGEVVTDLELPVNDGVLVADEASRVEWIPGVAWDVERDLLYVAHADRDAVVVVDVVAARVTGELHMAAATGGLAQLPTRAQPVVDVYEGAWRQALLTADGGLLYVHGSRTGPPGEPVEGQPDPPRERQLPLLVVDTAARAVLDLGETPRAAVLAASPGGEHVVVADGLLAPDGTPTLHVLDGRTLAPRWSLSFEGVAPRAWFSGDGRRLAVATGGELGDAHGELALFEAPTGVLLDRVRTDGRVLEVDLDAGLVLSVDADPGTDG